MTRAGRDTRNYTQTKPDRDQVCPSPLLSKRYPGSKAALTLTPSPSTRHATREGGQGCLLCVGDLGSVLWTYWGGGESGARFVASAPHGRWQPTHRQIQTTPPITKKAGGGGGVWWLMSAVGGGWAARECVVVVVGVLGRLVAERRWLGRRGGARHDCQRVLSLKYYL